MRFLIGFLVTIGLLIVVFILIFRGAANNDQAAEQAPQMTDYATTSTVMQLTEMGPVQSNQTHDEVRITVSNVEIAIEIFSGYNGNLVNTKTYANNTNAYRDFLAALDRAGYTKGDTSDESNSTYLGACPAGTRYIMGIKDGDDTIQNYWSSSCKLGGESFKGRTTVVRDLYQQQVPDYDDLTNNLFSLDQ